MKSHAPNLLFNRTSTSFAGRRLLTRELGIPQALRVARMIAEQAHSATGIDIHPGAQIGSRFFIDHGTGVVIGKGSVIGGNIWLTRSVAPNSQIMQSGNNKSSAL